MPSPPAIAIAVIGMLALGVGLGSAMSEIASSAPLSTILLEYPHHAEEAPPAAEEPEEEVEEGRAGGCRSAGRNWRSKKSSKNRCRKNWSKNRCRKK